MFFKALRNLLIRHKQGREGGGLNADIKDLRSDIYIQLIYQTKIFLNTSEALKRCSESSLGSYIRMRKPKKADLEGHVYCP